MNKNFFSCKIAILFFGFMLLLWPVYFPAISSAENTTPAGSVPTNQEKTEQEAPAGKSPDAETPKDESMDNTSSNISTDPDKAEPEQPSYPGVTNHHLQYGGDGIPTINIYYPSFGQEAVDKVMADFAEGQAKDYREDITESITPDDEKPESYENWDMSGFFTVDRPNPHIVSVTFNIYSYSGGAHGNLAITCLNYDLNDGKQIEFADLFKDPEKALTLLSSLTSSRLHKDLGEDADEDMIAAGTAPEMANFNCLVLLPDGLSVEFQPYQVGPWSIGPQHVKITLEDLSPAQPNISIWPKADASSKEENSSPGN